MQLLENNQTNQQQVSTTAQDKSSTKKQPQLTMVWVEEYHEGRQQLVAKWIVL